MERQTEYWVGLTNPNGATCNGSDCSNKLKWSDGSNFTWDPQIHSSIDATQSHYGFGFKVDERKFYRSVSDLPYACMSTCVGKSQLIGHLNIGYSMTNLVCEDAPPLVLNTLNDFNLTHQHYMGAIVR